jgi:chromosome segregation ATPase
VARDLDYERRTLNNPTIAWRKWTAATRVKKPKSRTAGVSASEHGRARATIEQLQGRVTELEEELAARDEEIKRLRAAVPRVQEADDVGR